MQVLYQELIKYGSRKFLGFSIEENPLFIALESNEILFIEQDKEYYDNIIYRRIADNVVFVTSNKTGNIYFLELDNYYIEVTEYTSSGVLSNVYKHVHKYKKDDITILDVFIEENQTITLKIDNGDNDINVNLKIAPDEITVLNEKAIVLETIYKNSEQNISLKIQEKTPLDTEYYHIINGVESKLVGRTLFYNTEFVVNIIEQNIGSLIDVLDIKTLKKVCQLYSCNSILDVTMINESIHCIENFNGIQKIVTYDIKTGTQLFEQNKMLKNLTGFLEFTIKTKDFYCLEQRSLKKGISFYKVMDGEYLSIKSSIGEDPNINISTSSITDNIKTISFMPSTGNCKKVIITLHGGPESTEWDEFRYWGLYRELIANNIGIIALNYAGSIYFGKGHQEKPWKNWFKVFSDEFNYIIETLKNKGIEEKNVIVLGGSFGATLALQTGNINNKIAGIIAIAPLVSLKTQLSKVESDVNYYKWFDTRFDLSSDSADFKKIGVEFYLKNKIVPVFLIQGTNDEVVSFKETHKLYEDAVKKGLHWEFLIERNLGHHPIDTAGAIKRIDNIKLAIESIFKSNKNKQPLSKEI